MASYVRDVVVGKGPWTVVKSLAIPMMLVGAYPCYAEQGNELRNAQYVVVYPDDVSGYRPGQIEGVDQYKTLVDGHKQESQGQLSIEQAHLWIIAPSMSRVEEVEDYFRQNAIRGFNLRDEWPYSIARLDNSTEYVPMYWFERTSVQRYVEDLINTYSTRSDNDWFWLPMYCNGTHVFPTPTLIVRMASGFSRLDLQVVVEEESAGFVYEKLDIFEETYKVQNLSRNGFDMILANERLNLRPEIRWSECVTYYWVAEWGAPPCPVINQNAPIPMLGGFASLLLVVAVLALGLMVLRNRITA